MMKSIKETLVSAIGNKYEITKLPEDQFDILYNLVLMANQGQIDAPELKEPNVKKALKQLWNAFQEIDG